MRGVIGLFLFLFLLIPLISAEVFSVELKPHYYVEGKETLIYNNETYFGGISFEIIGENFDEKNRILNLSIVNSYPKELENSLPKNTVEMLRIKQEKTLWISDIIDTSQFNQTNISFWINVSGKHEKTNEVLYSEGHLNIIINNKIEEGSGLLFSIGNEVWEGNSAGGLLIVLVGILIISFGYWHYEGAEKLNKWRDKAERKGIERKSLEEGWK